MTTLIKTSELCKSYITKAGQIDIIKGIDMTVSTGEVIAIIGASGVGKSTLLHLLGGLDTPTSGKIFHNDKDIFNLTPQELALFRNQSIGFIFQFHHLLPEFSALENIMMPGLISGVDREKLEEKALNLLDMLGLSKRYGHRPSELSGGEQQRVAVARALVLHPPVILADEPTGNLDTKAAKELFDLLLELNHSLNTTFVIVTHDNTLADRCHRIIRMVDGRLDE
ncbi:MAG: ABC transporter ATP-binding protein [Nitrospirae bacterium]|nr:ABC transporter ATP-binding protein [Nitrospirota bacterium]MBF0542156.1 ABC transporter ATP-binding protein [Nitrospirota bacterium]